MFKFFVNKFTLAASALLLCAAFAAAQTTEPVSPVTAAPTFVSIQYQLPGSAGPAANVTLTIPTGTDLFSIDPSTVPVWLTATPSGNTIVPAIPGPPETIAFQANTNAGALTAGVYTASIHIRVSGYQDLVVPVSLAVADVASTVSVQYNGSTEANNANIAITWVYGSAYPTATLSVISTDAPIAFTAASAVTTPANTVDWIKLPVTSGIAYNYGTALNITFLSDVLKNANVGDVLNGSVTIGYGVGPTTIKINFAITVAEPFATVSTVSPIFPAYVPLQGSGSVNVVVTGSGFISSGPNPTTVKVAYGTVTVPVLLTGISSAGANSVTGAVNIVNSSTMILTIPWQDASSVSILNTAQAIAISITNGLTINTVVETAATATLNVTNAPIVDSITSAASLAEPAAGVTPKFAPYEIVTVFGGNFGPIANTPVVGTVTSGVYPTSLTTAGGTLSVQVNKQDGTTLIAKAPLLFASNDQINMLIPSGVTAAGITGLQFVVTLGVNSSQPFMGLPATANPGVFTVTSSGQGQGAILNADFSVNSDANKVAPAGTVLIYVTGLGAPNSTGADTASTKAAAFPASCVSIANYETLASLTALDGTVILPADLATNTLPPCFATKGSPAVTIGGLAATVTYAGWSSGSVTGLYQINVTVPKVTAGDQPVVVSMGGATSQAGVTVAVN